MIPAAQPRVGATATRTEPVVSPPPPAPQPDPVFFTDADADAAGTGAAGAADLLAELVTHRGAEPPFLIGLFGAAGAGKSAFADRLLATARRFASDGAGSAFVRRIATVRIDASALPDPAPGIVAGLLTGLFPHDPDLVEEAAMHGGDPLEAATAAAERADDLRGKLDREREKLDELNQRRARLSDTVLFESPGSQVDLFAKANKARIEPRLRLFGFGGDDLMRTYRELVREAAERPGARSRLGLFLRSLWGYRGQASWLLLGLILLVAGIGAVLLSENLPAFNLWLDRNADQLPTISAWIKDHEAWLGATSRLALGLAALCVLICLLRAVNFLQPILRGAALLTRDLDSRRRELDSHVAHQVKRVDALAADLDRAARAAAAAERRMEQRGDKGRTMPDLSFVAEGLAPDLRRQRIAGSVVDALAGALGPADRAEGVPNRAERLIVLVDELDRLPPAEAARFLDQAHRLLARPHIVTIAAVDRQHVLTGLSETDPAFAAARLDRIVQLAYEVGVDRSPAEVRLARLLDRAAPAPRPEAARTRVAAGQSVLDAPWHPVERAVLTALAPFADATPRRLKRFVNSFRVARADPRLGEARPADIAALALALALDGTSAGTELAAGTTDGDASHGGMLGEAVEAVRRALGAPFELADAPLGLAVARSWRRSA